MLEGLNISDDGKRLVDWDFNDHVQLWDITAPADPELLASVSFSPKPDGGYSPSIDDAIFTPSNSKLAVTLDNGLFLVDTDPTSLERQYCAETSGITRSEWARYASNIPYQSPCSRG